MEIITFGIDVRLWDSLKVLEFCNLGYELFGTNGINLEKMVALHMHCICENVNEI